MMWRTAYLSKLPGLEKKVRVAVDWSIELFFPRDVVLTADVSTLDAPPRTSSRATEGATRGTGGGTDEGERR